jgi:hypothetical protein
VFSGLIGLKDVLIVVTEIIGFAVALVETVAYNRKRLDRACCNPNTRDVSTKDTTKVSESDYQKYLSNGIRPKALEGGYRVRQVLKIGYCRFFYPGLDNSS